MRNINLRKKIEEENKSYVDHLSRSGDVRGVYFGFATTLLLCALVISSPSYAKEVKKDVSSSNQMLSHMIHARTDFSWLFDRVQIEHMDISDAERHDTAQVEALAQVAEARGLGGRADVRAARQAADRLILAEAERRSLVDSIRPTDVDVAKRIAAHPGRYDEYRLRHIFIAVGATREGATRTEAEALELARRLRARIASGERFETVAQAASEDASTAAEGGALSELLGVTMDDVFYAQVRNLSVGAITEPVRGPDGFHLIRLDARQPASIPSARFWVEQDLIKERLPALIAEAIASTRPAMDHRR